MSIFVILALFSNTEIGLVSGIGFVIILRKNEAATAMNILKRLNQAPVIIGRIKKGSGKVIYEDIK